MIFVLVVGAAMELVRSMTRRPSVVVADDLCSPPCWNGITPGATSREEAYSILAATRGVEFGTIFDETRVARTAQFSWFFSPPIPDSTGRVYFADEQVAAILIGTYGSTDISEVIDMLGPPAAQWTHCASSRGREWAQTVLLWPEGGYAVVVDHRSSCPDLGRARVTGGDPVAQVLYFQSSRFPELLRTQSIFGPDSEGALASAQPWPAAGSAR